MKVPDIVKGAALAVAGLAGGWFANEASSPDAPAYFYRAQIAETRTLEAPGLPSYEYVDVVGYVEGTSNTKPTLEGITLDGYGPDAYPLKFTAVRKIGKEKAPVISDEAETQ